MNRILSFKGTHREIGEQVGMQYKAWGKREVWVPPYAKQYFPRQLKIYQQYFPEYLEYLNGIAKSLNIPEDKVLLSYLTGFLSLARTKPTRQCSVFVLKNKNGVLIGRNYDWRSASEKASALLKFQFTNNFAYSFIGITDMATWEVGKKVPSSHFVLMIDDAWNEHGLYVAVNGAPGIDTGVGMHATHLIQCVAEQCRTTEEAIKLIKEIPINESKILTIADRGNNFAVIEKPLDKTMFVRRSSELIFTTNHYNHPQLENTNLEIFETIPFHATFARYEYLRLKLPEIKEELHIENAIDLLSRPPLRQNWRGIFNGDSVTVWSYGLNLSTRKYIIDFAPIIKEKVRIQN